MRTHKTTEAAPDVGPTYAKAKAVAAMLGVHPKTIFRLANAGKISRRKINDRVVLFDLREIKAFVESTKITTGESSESPETTAA